MVIDRFYFSNGESAGSLEEFLDKLRFLNNESFLHHVREDKNDFANWIEFCIKDKVLANQVRKLTNQDKIIKVIEKRINKPNKDKKNIINQIKEAIFDG